MIEDEKKSGIDPVYIFILISLIIHGFLFFLIPKLPKPPQFKSEKPISVQFIEEPVKGERKPPKKPHVLGKGDITVKKEIAPENKPKIMGAKKLAKRHPPPSPAPPKPKAEVKQPEINLKPVPQKPPAPHKKEVKPVPKPKPKPKPKPTPKPPPQKKEVKPAPKRKVVTPKEEILTTPKKEKIKIAKAKPKPRVPSKKKSEKKPVPPQPIQKTKSEPGTTTKPSPPAGPPLGAAQKKEVPAPMPESLFPSAQTLHQIERKFSQSYPKDVEKGDVISLNTKNFKYISYFTHIKHKIELVWEYPRRAAEMGQEGSLLLRFTILKDGRLGGVKLLQSSGYRLLDQEAIRAVKNAAPFNPIPDRLHKNRLNILATFTYSLGFKFVY